MNNIMADENIPDISKYDVKYSDHKFWGKLSRVASKAGVKLVYMVLVLCFILKSPDISARDKGLIYGALGYFILPLDLIPDAIPAAGFTDDIAAITALFLTIRCNITPEIDAKAKKKLAKWFPKYTEEDITVE